MKFAEGTVLNFLFSKYRLQAPIFKIPASYRVFAKLAVKYRPGR